MVRQYGVVEQQVLLPVEAAQLYAGLRRDLFPFGARSFELVDVGGGDGHEPAELELAESGDQLRLAGGDVGLGAAVAGRQRLA